ncbi:MAG: hypothetical protein J0G29_02640 [Alphaproteobacteria bacterium]|nr:hypothetical protein [Alphaproteobacteria bacterium]OJV45178.1 MAG: hypothetical protein BGO28_00020 [Alphaproteobacteria bacterium 43-37]
MKENTVFEADSKIRLILESVKVLSDESFQKNCWLEGKCNGRFSSFEEEVCYIFDDYSLEEFLNGDLSVASLSQKQFSALSIFKDILEDFCNQTPALSNPEEIIKATDWQAVIQAAKNVLTEFNLLPDL